MNAEGYSENFPPFNTDRKQLSPEANRNFAKPIPPVRAKTEKSPKWLFSEILQQVKRKQLGIKELQTYKGCPALILEDEEIDNISQPFENSIIGEECRLHPGRVEKKYSKLISKKSFMDPSNGFLINDKCVFGVEAHVKNKNTIVEYSSLSKTVTTFNPPYSLEWKVSFNGSSVDFWNFTAGDCKWMVRVYPHGWGEGKDRSVSIYLYSVNRATKKKKVDFCFTIENPKSKLKHTEEASHWFTSTNTPFGWAEFVSIARMQEDFLWKDRFLLRVEISNIVSLDNVRK